MQWPSLDPARYNTLYNVNSGGEELLVDTASIGAGTGAVERLAIHRGRLIRSFWLLGIQSLDVGEPLSNRYHGRVFDLLPENGMTINAADARGEVALIISIPEEQLQAFEEQDWQIGHALGADGALEVSLTVGGEQALECPFYFSLNDEQDRQELMRLAAQESAPIYGVTHVSEDLLLTMQGEVPLPQLFREELARDVLAREDQSQGST
jgi:hypothetical protein